MMRRLSAVLMTCVLAGSTPAFADDRPDPQPEPGPSPAAPPPKQAAQQAPATDPRARPYFIKGELQLGSARPLARRNFVGIGAGISALPSSAGTALNAFFFTIEPQVDLRFPDKHDLKLGFSVPLAFEIADTRGTFESCIPVARDARDQSGGNQMIVDAATAMCVEEHRGEATENLGQLREQDWDEPSDFAKVIRYVTLGGEEQEFYLNVSRLYGQSIGHGTVVRRYNPNLDYDTARLGVTFDAYRGMVGFESIINDVLAPDVVGGLFFVRPFDALFPEVTPLRSLSFGAQVTAGLDVPRSLGVEEGLFTPVAGNPIPALDGDGNLVPLDTATVVFFGVDVETKLLRTQNADMKLYFDVQQMQDHGRGYTLGSLWRFSFGQPAKMAMRVRAEGFVHDADYLPQFFDSVYDVQKLQYHPAAYQSGMQTYYPTKLSFVEASAGGPRRLGGYLEVTHSFIGLLTVGLSVRGSKPLGDPATPGFAGPEFDDLSACTVVDGAADCTGQTKVTVPDAGYSSLVLYGEIPFKQVLQAFVSYEVFSTSIDGEGLDLFSFDGDNEVLFSGVRLQLLPILFVQGEARRFYFAQRLSDIDVDMGTIVQDQNLRADWTFAINIYAGLEF
jgi:hypothetical protein